MSVLEASSTAKHTRYRCPTNNVFSTFVRSGQAPRPSSAIWILRSTSQASRATTSSKAWAYSAAASGVSCFRASVAALKRRNAAWVSLKACSMRSPTVLCAGVSRVCATSALVPARVIVPEWGSVSPARRWRRVVLPRPFSPTMASRVAVLMVRLRSVNRVRPPMMAVSFSVRMCGV